MPRGERPLESEDGELLRFAADLRRLREKAGSPTYRELGRQAHYSAATLSEAASGRKLPTLAATLAYVAACGGDVVEWEARWRSLGTGDVVEDVGVAPYVGLAAFQTVDANRFFGREKLTEKLLSLVAAKRFVGVFGASGSGKSSLLRAGLVPALDVPVLVLTPSASPLEELAVRLGALMNVSAVELRDDLASDPAHLWLRIRQFDERLVLVVDQFEEAFTLAADAAWLVRALTSGPRVVIGVRADFYGHCGRFPELVEALENSQLLVGPMTVDELRRAITGPAERVGLQVETALVARLVADVAGQAAALPLVSHALVETWRRRRGMTLSLHGYEAAGGVEHAVARTAEDVFGLFSAEEQRVARLLFLRLIALGEGTEDTKRRVPRRELDVDESLVDRLAAARLISVDRDSVELTHEALIRSWPRLRDWIAEDREGLRVHRGLIDATDAWESHDRDPDALYRGVRLTQAKDLGDVLTGREREFLDASVALELREQRTARRRTRRLRALVALLSVLVLVLGGVVVFAVRAERTSTEERNRALSLRAADAAVNMTSTDARKAVRLALAAYRLSPTIEARDAMSGAQAEITKAQFAGTEPMRGPRNTSMSPGGDIAAGAYGDNGLFLLDISRGTFEPGGRMPDAGNVDEFSGDERTLVTIREAGEAGNRIQVWDIASLANPRQILDVTRPVFTGDLSDSGDLLVVTRQRWVPAGADRQQAGWDPTGEAALWRISDSGRIEEVAIPVAGVQAVQLRGDGKKMAVMRQANATSVVELWSVGSGGAPTYERTLYEGDDYLSGFSRDGRFIMLHPRQVDAVRVMEVSGEVQEWSTIPTRGALALFAPDNTTVLTTTVGSLTAWNIANKGSPARVASFGGLPGSIDMPTYRPETREVLGVEINTGLWRFDLDTDRLIKTACTTRDMELPDADWEEHFPGVKPVAVCQ